jgi:hypothetical protein
MAGDIPTDVIAPILGLGVPGSIILILIWALVRKDRQVDTLQEARVDDQKERAADNIRAASVIESLNQAARQREEASDARWRVMEGIVEIGRATAKAVEAQGAEVTRIGRLIDANTIRIERIDRNRGEE